MPKGNIKADVLLRLDGWVAETEAPLMNLASSADDIPVGSGLVGSIEVSATRFYQLMKEQKANGRLPLLRLQIIDPDAQVKQAELEKQKEKDKKSPKLDLKGKDDAKKDGKKPDAGKEANKQTNGEKAAAARKAIAQAIKDKEKAAKTPKAGEAKKDNKPTMPTEAEMKKIDKLADDAYKKAQAESAKTKTAAVA